MLKWIMRMTTNTEATMHILLFVIGALLHQTVLRQRLPAVPARTITFSGVEWTVKRSESRVGPGPNHFSASPENVFVDKEGRLHLKITHRDGKWLCAEVVSKRSFGYGTYRFTIVSSVQFDPQAVWGFFTWHSGDPAYHHREIDIEFGRWGRKESENAQFVVQPYTHPQNLHRFAIPEAIAETSHRFTWQPDQIIFHSRKVQSAEDTEVPPKPEDVLQSWTYRENDLPKAGGENVRINLWLLAGTPPTDGEEVEIIVQKFVFTKSSQNSQP